MYAVFEDGSRQYKVSEGDKVKVDYREAEIGTRLEFPRVLLYAGGETVHIIAGCAGIANPILRFKSAISCWRARNCRRKRRHRLRPNRPHRQPNSNS